MKQPSNGLPAILMTAGMCSSLAAGCSSSGVQAPVQAGETVVYEAEEEELDEDEQAQKLFGELSEKLGKLEGDETVEEAWVDAQLRAVLAMDDSHALARFNLAVLAERKGERQQARAVYEELADDDDDFAPARENLAHYLVAEGEIDEAVETYRDIVADDPKNETSRLGLARILMSRKKYKEAIDLSRDVLQHRADAVEAFRILAWCYKEAGNPPMAELTIGRGLKIAPRDVELHYITSQILLERDDLAAGIDKLKEVVRMDPKRLGVRAQLGEIAMSYRDFGNAAQQYEAVLKEKPDHRGAKLRLAVCYKGLGRFEQAAKIYAELLAQRADDPDALWNLAVVLHRHLRKYDDAIATYGRFKSAARSDAKELRGVDERIAEIEKTKSDLEAARLQAEREQKLREAIASLCAAVSEGKPGKPEQIGNEQERTQVAWQLLVDGQAAIEQGDIGGGEALVKCAFAAVPDTPKAATDVCAPMRVLWTQILYQLGRLQDAVASIKEALQCDPNNPDAQLIEQQLAQIIEEQQTTQPQGAAQPPTSQ